MTAHSNAIYLVNQSTNVSDADLMHIARACHVQIGRDVAPAWGLIPSPVFGVPKGKPVPVGGWNIVVMDTLDQADAAGWHTEDGQGIHGVVGTKVWLDHGGTVLTGPNSVATTASHEVVELFADRTANVWRDTGNGWAMIQELCDPVEGDAYDLSGASVSNFVLPAYFDPVAPQGSRFDHLGKLSQPFSLDAGGYCVYEIEGKTGQQFADQVPAWKRTVKQHPASRVQHICALRDGVV